jgi:hypothetical protein
MGAWLVRYGIDVPSRRLVEDDVAIRPAHSNGENRLMNRPHYVPWPAGLNWIIAQLKAAKLQRFIHTPTDRGLVERRPDSLAIDGLTGSVTLTEDQWNALPRAEGIMQVENAAAGQPNLVQWWDPPFVSRETIVGGGLVTREVMIQLIVIA